MVTSFATAYVKSHQILSQSTTLNVYSKCISEFYSSRFSKSVKNISSFLQEQDTYIDHITVNDWKWRYRINFTDRFIFSRIDMQLYKSIVQESYGYTCNNKDCCIIEYNVFLNVWKVIQNFFCVKRNLHKIVIRPSPITGYQGIRYTLYKYCLHMYYKLFISTKISKQCF